MRRIHPDRGHGMPRLRLRSGSRGEKGKGGGGTRRRGGAPPCRRAGAARARGSRAKGEGRGGAQSEGGSRAALCRTAPALAAGPVAADAHRRTRAGTVYVPAHGGRVSGAVRFAAHRHGERGIQGKEAYFPISDPSGSSRSSRRKKATISCASTRSRGWG